MPIGPFTTYAPPGVYTRTTQEPVIGQLLGGLRVPVLIGVAQESLSQTDFEMVRGSSSSSDTPIFGEDPSGRWKISGPSNNPILGAQNGSYTTFKVRNFPIVDGEGSGRTTFDVSKVSVFVNGVQTVIGQVDGTNGLLTILTQIAPTDIVSVNYYFRRRDTSITDDVSDQVSDTSAVLTAPKSENYNITTGTNDDLQLFIDDSAISTSITLTPGSRTASDIANDINSASINGLLASSIPDNRGFNHVSIVAKKNIRIGSGNANGILGYNPGDYTNRTREFRVFQGPVVDGSDGGVTTTDTSKIVVIINGVQTIPVSVDGLNRLITLAQAPDIGSTVTVQYWFNTFQDTFDYLPNSNVLTVGNIGISPSRRDFLNGPDFIVVNNGDQSKIIWGTAYQVVSGEVTNNVPLDSTQVTALLVDDRVYAIETKRYTDVITNVVSTTKFILPLKPTTGNGRDTPLGLNLFNSVSNGRIDLPTNRPDLITVHIGKNVRDALAKPAVQVVEANSSENSFTLKDPVSADLKAFATFWYNTIVDDTYTLNVVTAGPSGTGRFTVSSKLNNDSAIMQTMFGVKSALPETVQWPSGVESIPDAFHYGGSPVSETLSITFDSSLLPATNASFSNALPEPYDIYSALSVFGGIIIDGNPPISVDLSTGFAAVLLGKPVSTALMIAPSDYAVINIDGINIDPVSLTGSTNLTSVAVAINAVIDADIQTHTDLSATFASTAPNNLVSVITYGSLEILKISGRNTKSLNDGLYSNVKILTPTLPSQTDAFKTLGFSPNLESYGSYDALNDAPIMHPSNSGPYIITSGINDTFLFNVNGSDYSSNLPAGTSVTTDAVVNYINAGYVASASVTEQATAELSAIALANDIQTNYNAHIADAVTYHSVADVTNTSVSAVATDLATLLALINELKIKFNSHIINIGGVYHSVADMADVVIVQDATDLKSAVILAFSIKEAFSIHQASAVYHLAADTVNIVTSSNAELVAITGQGVYSGFFYLTTKLNTVDSRISISSLGTANTVLGFTSGTFVTRDQPTASIIVNALNYNASFNALAVAWPINVAGLGTYIRIDSNTTGTTSTISFIPYLNSIFTSLDTGIGIYPGTSGDTGEASQSGFNITSSNPNGTFGTGIPGQTYINSITGLRFTILPASSGDYSNGGSFTLIVGSNWIADAAIPSRGIAGLETTVFNTIGMGVGTTALLSTFNKGGSEPGVGDTYFVSYKFAKTDLSTMLFRDLRKIHQNFGPPTPENPLALGARLALLNGAVLIGLKQVLRAPDSSQASIVAFLDAIDEQRKPIEGSVKPDIITPLGTDPQIFAALNKHCIFMGAPRQEGERIGIVGVAAGTTPVGVRAIAQAINSELMVVTYPDSYIISVQDNFGNMFDQLVDGSYMAAALAGTFCNPSIDVATPWTRRQVTGFKKLGRILDPTESNQVAVSGVSIIEFANAGMRIRHGLTTRLDTVITRTPSVTLTIQYVQQAQRQVLDPYVGQKFSGSLIKDVENTLTGLFSNLIGSQIVAKVVAIAAESDENDPTVLRASAIYVPVFPSEYIISTLQIRIRI